MANNKGKGGKKFKNRKRGKNNEGEDQKRELIIKEEGQEYAEVLRMLGNGRLRLHWRHQAFLPHPR